jgi:putative ABC transport system substrate-binding protein
MGFTLAALFVGFVSADAQQTAKIPRIGYVSGTGTTVDQGPYIEALRRGLRDLGHSEGRTYAIEYRGAEGKLDRVPSIMNELSKLRVDVIVAPFSGAVRAAKQSTATIPIVMVTGTDPIGNGWVQSLARPGGNITGVFTLAQDLNGKRLELLMEVVPRVSSIGILWAPSDRSGVVNYKE